jgi:hypothetical protein
MSNAATSSSNLWRRIDPKSSRAATTASTALTPATTRHAADLSTSSGQHVASRPALPRRQPRARVTAAARRETIKHSNSTCSPGTPSVTSMRRDQHAPRSHHSDPLMPHPNRGSTKARGAGSARPGSVGKRHQAYPTQHPALTATRAALHCCSLDDHCPVARPSNGKACRATERSAPLPPQTPPTRARDEGGSHTGSTTGRFSSHPAAR